MLTDERVAEIRERLENAADTPWAASGFDVKDTDGGSIIEVVDNEAEFMCDCDATFVANAPQDIADLLDEVERLRGMLLVVSEHAVDLLNERNDLRRELRHMTGEVP